MAPAMTLKSHRRNPCSNSKSNGSGGSGLGRDEPVLGKAKGLSEPSVFTRIEADRDRGTTPPRRARLTAPSSGVPFVNDDRGGEDDDDDDDDDVSRMSSTIGTWETSDQRTALIEEYERRTSDLTIERAEGPDQGLYIVLETKCSADGDERADGGCSSSGVAGASSRAGVCEPPALSAASVFVSVEEKQKEGDADVAGGAAGPSTPTAQALAFPPGRLYGRAAECAALRSALGRFLHHNESSCSALSVAVPVPRRSEIVILSGHSGSGKSALAESLRAPALGSGLVFARGKFDRMRQHEPYSAIGDAFEGLCRDALLLHAAAEAGGQMKKVAASALEGENGDAAEENGGDDEEDDALSVLRDSIEDAVGDSWKILALIAPSLRTIMKYSKGKGGGGRRQSDPSVGGRSSSSGDGVSVGASRAAAEQTRENFQYVCATFLRVLTTPASSSAAAGSCRTALSRPAVIFLDDLQWADWPSLDLLVSLSTNPDLGRSALFVGAYRDNEVGEDHPLASRLVDMAALAAISRIDVAELIPDAVNELTSDAMGMEPDDTRRLADEVHRMTRGNVLFARQLLCSLVDEGLVRPSPEWGADGINGGDASESKESEPTADGSAGDRSSPRWTWDAEAIAKRAVPEDVLSLLTRRMRDLPPGVVSLLTLASFLGTRFEASTLGMLSESVGPSFQESLARAVREGLLELESPPLAALGGEEGAGDAAPALEGADIGAAPLVDGAIRFAHDRIQQAAYELVPQAEAPLWHLQVGESLWGDASPLHLDDRLLFVVADQISRGLGGTDARRGPRRGFAEIAQLNSRAGARAMASSSFASASSYVRAGIDALERVPEHWENEYALSLRLFNMYADAAYCNGNFSQMEETLNQLFARALTLHDKMRGYKTLISSLMARERLHEAINTGFDILADLGEKIPRRVTKPILLKDMVKTRLALVGMSDERILALPIMKNQDKLDAMEILSVLLFNSYISRMEFMPLITFRMVRLTVRYGLCNVSSTAFVLNGMLMCGTSTNYSEGYRYSRLAMSLLEKFDHKDCQVRVPAIFYVYINHWAKPMKDGMEPLLDAHNRGVLTGDIESAMAALSGYAGGYISCGLPLEKLEQLLRVSQADMLQKGQEAWCKTVILPVWQVALNLLGQSDDPLIMTGEAMNQAETLLSAAENGNSMQRALIMYYRLILATVFGKHDLAMQIAEESRNMSVALLATMIVTRYYFYEGVSAIAMAKQTNESSYNKIAKSNIQRLKKLDSASSGNRAHLILLLKAGYSSLQGKLEKAARRFGEAISLARSAGFVHDEALANEIAGEFHLGQSNDEKASEHMRQAYDCYLQWGAGAKSDQLRRSYPQLISS